MVQVYYVFFQIFVCFILGFVLNKTRVLDMRGEKVMTEILLKAVLPFMIISSSQTNFSFEERKAMGAMFAFGAAYYSLALVLSKRAYKETKATDDEQRVMTTCTVFANTGFVGFPLMRALYGDRGLLLAAVFNLVYNAFFYTYGAHIISTKQHFKISELFASTVGPHPPCPPSPGGRGKDRCGPAARTRLANLLVALHEPPCNSRLRRGPGGDRKAPCVAPQGATNFILFSPESGVRSARKGAVKERH